MTRGERTKPPKAHKKESTRDAQKGIAIARFSNLEFARLGDKSHNLLNTVNLYLFNTVAELEIKIKSKSMDNLVTWN